MTSTGSCNVEEKIRKEVLKMAKESTLTIPALHCGGCASTVTRTLETLPSVGITLVDPATKLVRFRFDETAVSLDQIREALDQVGFSAEE